MWSVSLASSRKNQISFFLGVPKYIDQVSTTISFLRRKYNLVKITSSALSSTCRVQLPDITVRGDSIILAGLFSIFIKGESGTMASIPGSISTLLLVAATSASNDFRAAYTGFATMPVDIPMKLRMVFR